jgi:uncharacterized protein YjiS (DUF1127 family)
MWRTTLAANHLVDTDEIRRAVRRDVLKAARQWLGATAMRAAAAWAEQQRINHAIAELSGLSDRMLRDIGVERHDIERIARYGHDASERGR